MGKKPLLLGSVSFALLALLPRAAGAADDADEPAEEVAVDDSPAEPEEDATATEEDTVEGEEAEASNDPASESGSSEGDARVSVPAEEADPVDEGPKEPPADEGGEPASGTDEAGPAPEPLLEEDDAWLQWPYSKKNMDDRPKGAHRWASAGGFVGMVSRPSGVDSIRYRPGIAWGGYLRPELRPWLGLRLYYREERIKADVEPGAYDFEGETYDDEFEQGQLEVLTLGGRLEPTWVAHPRLRLRGIVGLSWLTYRAPHPTSDTFQMKRSFRSAVEMDVSFGAGLSFDIVKNWVDISLDATYGLSTSRSGSAYEPAQIVRDGAIQHIAPLPELKNSTDLLISLGVIL